MQIAVIGAGSWGSTLANLLARNGHEVSLWVREKELAEEMRDKRENTWFLPGVSLHEGITTITTSIAEAVAGKGYILIVVPAQFVRPVLEQMLPHLHPSPVLICASKGIEVSSLKTMSQVVEEVLSSLSPIYAVLSGPSFAKEVSRGLPTAVALGCREVEVARRIQHLFSCDYFRVYTNVDYKGVELGGAIKNVIAIGAGICDGLGFGDDARAALITRGLAEMARLGERMGANKETFMGLSGLGDLVLTCTGDLSRNRQVGLRIGAGAKLEDILKEMKMVAEGVKTCEALYRLGEKMGVEMPITQQVYSILYRGKDPRDAVEELMLRRLKSEW